MSTQRTLVLALVLTGCAGSEPVPVSTVSTASTSDAPAATTGQGSPSVTLSPLDGTAAASKPEPGGVVKPSIAIHLSEIVERVDLRKLEPLDGMTVSTATIEQWVAGVPAAAGKTPEQVLEQLERRLLSLGCVPTSQADLNSNNTKFLSRVFVHGDLLIEAGVTEVERFGSPPELLAYIRPLGNLDLRKFVWPEGTEVKQSGLTSAQLHGQGGILDCRKRFSELLTQSGWQEYRDFLPGVDIPVEDMVPRQAFLWNGMTLQVIYRDDQEALIKDQAATGSINCQVSLSVAPYEPLLPGLVTDLKVRWSPLALVYETELAPAQLRERLERLLAEQGYRVSDKPSESAEAIHLTCEHVDRIDLGIEFKQSGKRTLVVVNEMQ